MGGHLHPGCRWPRPVKSSCRWPRLVPNRSNSGSLLSHLPALLHSSCSGLPTNPPLYVHQLTTHSVWHLTKTPVGHLNAADQFRFFDGRPPLSHLFLITPLSSSSSFDLANDDGDCSALLLLPHRLLLAWLSPPSSSQSRARGTSILVVY